MTLFENIKALRVEKDWTQGDLAKFAGVSIETIKRYENGKTNPTNDNLSKIANALGVEIKNLYDGASPSVSLSQKNNMSLSAKKVSPSLSNLKKTEEADQVSYDQILIRKLSSAVGAGESVDINGVEVYDTDILVPFSQMLFKVRPKKADRIRCMQVDGYSMVPMLFPDSWVIADVTAKFEGDGLYIINYCDNFMVKLLQKSPDGTLHIKSVNKDYESYDIGPDDDAQVYIVGKVLRCVI
ncbi:LexA family transcriptional regulator [uncultured Campylobacter sp.]|uniref:XRE family transcriptional regulator n=1 Tax=uncultured Campylobacter sp. TaxID=218934 RepID=UPI0026232CB7|nr:LexA family transcriptional regulator [uncultured Campylobacter sp.]